VGERCREVGREEWRGGEVGGEEEVERWCGEVGRERLGKIELWEVCCGQGIVLQ